MVAFKVKTFGGMYPAVADELLPDEGAVLSQNAWLYTGNFVGLPVLKELHTLVNPAATKVYRLPETYGRASYLYNSVWMEFGHPDTDVVRAPVFGDTHDRYYWASPTTDNPRYNTRERIEDSLNSWYLGINPPAAAPDVNVAGGSIRLADVRVITTTSGVLSTDYIVGAVVNGVTLKLADRILINNQTGLNAFQNGVRVVAAAGAPARATDMDTSNEFVKRSVKVLEGLSSAGTFWECENTTPPVVGTDAISFKEIAALPLEVTRSYVYTWVTQYGEESAPGQPTVKTGIQDGTWEITGIEPPAVLDRGPGSGPDAKRWITKTRLYRTITSTFGVATFFLVVEQDAMLTTFTDDKTDDEVSQNDVLESFTWTPPPADLQGLTMMWNGMVAGFRENELWFCEPYRPHAWPASYVLTVEYPIVGLGVAGQMLVACTAGNPVIVMGAISANLNSTRVAKFEQCTSRGSILSSPNGVVFASPTGLVRVSTDGAINVTKSLVLKEQWEIYAGEARLRAAWLQEAYYAFGGVSPNVFSPTAFSMISNDLGPPGQPAPARTEEWVTQQDYMFARNGVLIDPNDIRVAFNTLTSETPVLNVQNDVWSGEVFIIKDGKVFWLDIADKNQSVVPGIWKSKKFQTNDKRNLGAMRIYFKPTPDLPVLGPRSSQLEQTLGPQQWGLCRLYADDKLVMTRELRTSGELWKLPSGFLADFWQYEVETRLRILNIQIASSAKELANV